MPTYIAFYFGQSGFNEESELISKTERMSIGQ